MTDSTSLQVLAVGNHRVGYIGVIRFRFTTAGESTQYGCHHRHPTTQEARNCIRDHVHALVVTADDDWARGYQ